MNNSPSIYLPRQHRPRRNFTQNSRLNDTQDTTSLDTNAISTNTFVGAARVGITTPKQQPPAEIACSSSNTAMKHTIAVSNSTGDTSFSAVSISGQLGTQLHRFRDQTSLLRRNKPSVCAFLLGYTQGDGTVNLNMLDYGVVVDGKRLPTAAYDDDVVVPLFCGASKLDFYSCVFRNGGLYKVAGWILDQQSYSELVVEFVTTSVDMWISVQKASEEIVGSLSSLIDNVRRGSNISQGSLTWNEHHGCYEYTKGLVIPPENAVWVATSSGDSDAAVGNVYLDAGAPHSLFVVHIEASANRSLALTQSYRIEPSNTGKFTIHIKLGSIRLPESSEWSTCTAKLLCPDQYEKGIASTISTISEQNGIIYSPAADERGLVRSPKQYVSPFIQKIAAVTNSSTKEGTFRIHTAADVEDVRFVAGTTEPYHMAELLQEQRNIRELLQEQNNLIRTQVSQAQEMMRIMNHQPSPQTVTRRYLRMRGTHTPSLTDAPNPGVRRTNSLSEIVDGIRSFELEGYEETEHHTINNSKRPTASLTMSASESNGSTRGAVEALPASSGVSSGTVSGISSLVSRINNIVSTSDEAPKQGGSSKTFSRPPPMPGYHKQPAAISSHKITPTTQKYLESLERRQSSG